ncbi:MAG: RdgB/HAM1 family non-canonical purine NTP pyrophosphatase [Rickettsiales bacterium]
MSIILDPKQPLVVATHNKGKLVELQHLLAPLGFSDIRSAGELGVPEPEETGATFADNAVLKSEHASRQTGFAALADDSGLEVQALNGAPGIYSARWAGPNKDFGMAMQKIEEGLKVIKATPTGAKARFVCVLALSIPNQRSKAFMGTIHGTLIFPPRGNKGFGYDPIFIPENHTVTFAEMDPEEKDRISHRAHAFAGFLDFLKGKAA